MGDELDQFDEVPIVGIRYVEIRKVSFTWYRMSKIFQLISQEVFDTLGVGKEVQNVVVSSHAEPQYDIEVFDTEDPTTEGSGAEVGGAMRFLGNVSSNQVGEPQSNEQIVVAIFEGTTNVPSSDLNQAGA